MIKLAVFDVDGTLRDKDFIPQSTISALRKLREAGIQLALCTGRSECEVKDIRSKLGIEWAVMCNGSHISHHGRTMFGRSFPHETIRSWLKIAEDHQHAMLLYGEEEMYISRENDPYFQQAVHEIGFKKPRLIQPTDELPAFYQCILFCRESEESLYLENMESAYYLHRWREWAVDIVPGGCNKAKGLTQLLRELKLEASEVAAIGDGLNDLEMLEWAGTGIAMGNASPELMRKADYITKPLHEDGILYAVERWILR